MFRGRTTRAHTQTHLELPADEELVEDIVGLVEVEDNIKLAHVSEVTVQDFHEQVNLFEGDQLVVILVYARHKEQRGVPVVFPIAHDVFAVSIVIVAPHGENPHAAGDEEIRKHITEEGESTEYEDRLTSFS